MHSQGAVGGLGAVDIATLMERAELKAQKKRHERVSVQARRFDTAMRFRGVEPEVRGRGVRRFRANIKIQNRLDEAALYIADTTSGCPRKERFALMNLGRALYGAWKRRAGDDVMERMAQVAGKRLADGYHREAVLDVLARCWGLLVGEFPRTDIERVRDLAESYGQGSTKKEG